MRDRLLTSTVLVGVTFATFGVAAAQTASNPQQGAASPAGASNLPATTAGSAAAQGPVGTPEAAADATDQSGQPTGAPQAIVVTGSRIASPNLKSISPVATVNSAEIKLEGTTRVEDLINNLPQAFASQGGNISNGATGTANANLRNLGASRTLVLVDGKRLMPGDPASPFADLNVIPAALIDRVDVLTGGASAVYGSDAVAGVVNFIMQKDFQGVRVDAQENFFNHDNGNTTIQGLERARGFPAPNDTYTGGYTTDLNLTLGVNAPDGKGNATFYAGWRHIDSVTQGNYDYSACNLAEAGASFACAGSGTTSPARFISNGGAPAMINGATVKSQTLTLDRTSGALRAYSGATDAFNFAPYNYYQRPDERYSAGVFAHYQIDPKVDVYGSFMFIDDKSVAQIAPSGVFSQTINVPCSSSLLSAAEVGAFCTRFGYTAADSAPVSIGKRNVEGGGRSDNIEHTDYRILGGVRGDLDDVWHYDVSAQFSRVVYQERYDNDFSLRRTQQAIAGCPAGSDQGCVPYNIFSLNSVTPEALSFLQTPGFKEGQTEEQVVTASISGQLGKYGIKSPFADDGLGVALGTEYRRESSDLRTDVEFATGDLAGQGGPTIGLGGSFDVYELFGEARLPLVQNKPFIDSLNVETAYRFSDYSTAGKTDTYKLGFDYSPTRDVRFRTSYNRSVRAPNVVELFQAQAVVLDGSSDPCAGDNPAAVNALATAANCARTGVSAAQYGNINDNSANQYNGLTGGNPNLKPERSDTYTGGVVFTPRFLPGFSLAMDYFNIDVENVIGTVGADLTINQCLATGNPFFCGLIHRSPGSGSLYLNPNGYIQDTNINTGSVKTAGVDVDANYRYVIPQFGGHNLGSLGFNFVGTYTDKFEIKPVPGGGSYDCTSRYGTVCLGSSTPASAPIPQWRHRFRVTYTTPYNVQVSASWRYISHLTVDAQSPNPLLAAAVYPVDSHIPSFNYLDLAVNWRVKDGYTLRAGVNNVLDKDPPIIGSNSLSPVFGNGNTYPQTYDALGRQIFVGLTADF